MKRWPRDKQRDRCEVPCEASVSDSKMDSAHSSWKRKFRKQARFSSHEDVVEILEAKRRIPSGAHFDPNPYLLSGVQVRQTYP